MAQGFLGNTANRIQLGGYTKPMMQQDALPVDELQRRYQLADAMLKRRLANDPVVEHWLQGASHLAGVWREKRETDRADEDYRKASEIGKPVSSQLESALMRQRGSIEARLPETSFTASAEPIAGKTRPKKGDSPLDAPMTRSMQEDIVGAQDSIAQLERLQALYDPRYQTLTGKLGQWGSSGASRLGMDLSPETRADLDQFRRYQSTALSFANDYIKKVTGAQMSETEAERILATLPNAGSGIFDWGDDPVTFEAKLNEALGRLRSVVARRMFYLNQGVSDPRELEKLMPAYAPDFPERMREVITKRGMQIESSLRKQGLSDTEIKQRTRAQLRQEFGL